VIDCVRGFKKSRDNKLFEELKRGKQEEEQ